MGNFKKYIVLWLSQSISQLGSSMTAFALVLWVYEQTHSAHSVSLISFCNYVPYILTSIFIGSFIDSHRKKSVMLVADCIACNDFSVYSGLFNSWKFRRMAYLHHQYDCGS